MDSLYEGPVEFKGKGGWWKAHGVLTRGKLELFNANQSVVHTVMLSPTSAFKEDRTKTKERGFYFDIVTATSAHHFRVDSEADRTQWGDYIKTAMKPHDYSKSATLPGRRKPPLIQVDPIATDICTTAQLTEKLCDDPQECVQNVYPLKQIRPGSPTDSGFGSGGAQFSRTHLWQPVGLSDDSVIRHKMPTRTTKSRANLSVSGIRSVGSSPFTSPGTSADGTFIRLNKYKWYLGVMSRDEVTSVLMKEKGSVFGLRENLDGIPVLSIKKLDKASNSYKVTHHLIKTDKSTYWIAIDEDTVFSGSDILGLLKQFVQDYPECLPLGGSLHAIKEEMDDDSPSYDYAWDPDEMGYLIQQRVKKADAAGRKCIGGREHGSTDKAKCNHAQEQWNTTTHASQSKPSGGGGATAVSQGWAYCTNQQQGEFMSDLRKKLGERSASGNSTTRTKDKKPLPTPRTTTAKTRHQQLEESQLLYGSESMSEDNDASDSVHSQPAKIGSDTPIKTDTVKASEAALGDLCWIPFDFQSQSVRPGTRQLCLQQSTSAMVGEEKETILLQVPPGAVNPYECVEIRSAVIPDGPFMLPKGYQLGSMVVYIHYDGRQVTCPLKLQLPHWYGGEDHIRDGLAFAMAPHTLKEGECGYHFKLLQRGRRLSDHCGELKIDGHCSLFAEVFKEGAISRYQAIFLQRERGNETTCDVALTYASPLWCDILLKCRSGWEVNKHSYPIMFEEDKIKGNLSGDHGNGWHAAINGPSELQPDDVGYSSHGITSSKLLKKAVLNKGYPPAITCAITYREELRRTGRPVWVQLNLLGAGKELAFMCKAYEDADCRRGNAAAAAFSQSPLTPPPDMMGISPFHIETVSDAATSITPPPTPSALNTANIIEAFNHQLDAKWKHFGTFLHVDYQTMQAIKTGNANNPEDCMLDLLGKWTSKQAGTGTLPRTWQTVVDAVNKTGYGAIAENLALMHGLKLSQ